MKFLNIGISNITSAQTDFQLGSVKTVKCSLRALRYLGPKIWNIGPFEIKKK